MRASTIGAACRRSRRIMSTRRRHGPLWMRSHAPRKQRASNWSSGWRSIPRTLAMPTDGSIQHCGLLCFGTSTPTDGRAPMNGPPAPAPGCPIVSLASAVQRLLMNCPRSWDGLRPKALGEGDIVRLFRCRGDEFAAVCTAADELRQASNGETVSYVVTRNINYTNICYFKCGFCAFSKGKLSENLRGRPYELSREEVARRAREAWARGATEVCMQGGIHPSYDG